MTLDEAAKSLKEHFNRMFTDWGFVGIAYRNGNDQDKIFVYHYEDGFAEMQGIPPKWRWEDYDVEFHKTGRIKVNA